MHRAFKEAAFLGATMVEKYRRVLNRDHTIVDTLKQSLEHTQILSSWVRKTNIQQQESAIRLVHDAGLDERELLLGVLDKVLGAFVAVLLGPAIGNAIPYVSLVAPSQYLVTITYVNGYS